jgi:protein TonB
MGGTLARPATGFSLPPGAIGVANLRRLTAAALTVIGLHAALLAFKPGAPAANFVAPSAPPVMAVRMVRSQPALREAAAIAPPPPAPTVAPLPTPALAPALAERTRPAVAERASSERARPQPAAEPATPPRPAPPGRPATGQDVPLPAPTRAAHEAAAADASLAAAPDYAFGARLDPGPRPLTDIEPDYPDMAHLREGVVVLRVLISERGVVDNVAVVRAEPRGVFEQAAIEAFSKARFSPGLAAGTPVKSQITVEVQFMPINRGARVSGKTY